jgi:hypothetical protein
MFPPDGRYTLKQKPAPATFTVQSVGAGLFAADLDNERIDIAGDPGASTAGIFSATRSKLEEAPSPPLFCRAKARRRRGPVEPQEAQKPRGTDATPGVCGDASIS